MIWIGMDLEGNKVERSQVHEERVRGKWRRIEWKEKDAKNHQEWWRKVKDWGNRVVDIDEGSARRRTVIGWMEERGRGRAEIEWEFDTRYDEKRQGKRESKVSNAYDIKQWGR
jgi:hypothetical protein